MTSSRLFLTSMCGPGNADSIREMIEPIRPWLDGIVWVLHDCPVDDAGAQYLESVKGEGRIIHKPWPRGRHFASMNDTLWCGPIEEGELVIWTDLLERPAPEFVSRIKPEIGVMMEINDLDVVAAWGKPYLLRYRETMEYRGSPHWYIVGWNQRGIEWNTIEPDEAKVRFNARPLHRTDPFQWVSHYLKYYVSYPAGSNHCMLGLEKNGDPKILFPVREARRLEFRRYLKDRGIPLTVEGVVSWLRSEPDDEGKAFIRAEKILNDAWRFYILNDPSLVDNHDFKDMVLVP